MHVLRGAAEQGIHRSVAIREKAHSAASTGANRFIPSPCFGRERLSLIVRASNPNSPARFALGIAFSLPMPSHIDSSETIGCDRAATIETISALHQIPLRLELRAFIVEPRKKHW